MRRLRFSLFDLFIIVLGVAAGLAYHRVSGVRWTEAFLASCAAWITVGMVQQARTTLLVWGGMPRADREARLGAALAFARPLAVIAMFAAAIGFDVAKKIDQAPNEYWPFDAFTPSLFSLAVICAYVSPGRREAVKLPRRRATFRVVLDVVALLFGAALLVYTLVSTQTISALVHLAIRGAEASQPTRWNGKPFYPFDPQIELTREFFRRAVAAAVAASLAAISTFLLADNWHRRALRWLLICVAAASIGLAAYWDHWYWTVGFPKLSPLLAQNTGTQPWYVLAAGMSVAAGACFLFVMRYAPESYANAFEGVDIPNAYHVSAAIMVLLLFAMLADVPDWWNYGSTGIQLGFPGPFRELQSWWDSGARLLDLPLALFNILCEFITYWLDEPKMLLRVAAMLVVANRFRRWRGGAGSEAIVPARAGKLIALSLLTATTLLVAIPAGAWLGFAIMSTAIAGL